MKDAPSYAVEISNVCYRYGTRTALAELSFSVREGEIFGLLGPNGSGKTTLFRILATLLRPESGRVRIFGRDVMREAAAVRRSIGVVFQSPSLDMKLTASENLHHQGRLYGLHGKALRKRVNDSLEYMGVAERKNDILEKLSGGLRRRVEVAKCLLHRPPLLLLDEPSTGLDPAARRDFWKTLETLREDSKITVLLTTHQMEEAEACGRLALMSEGKLAAIDSPEALKAKINGQVLCLKSEDPEKLVRAITERFDVRVQMQQNHTLRIEDPDAVRLALKVVEAFPTQVRSLSVGKGTLEDVFLHETGHRLSEN